MRQALAWGFGVCAVLLMSGAARSAGPSSQVRAQTISARPAPSPLAALLTSPGHRDALLAAVRSVEPPGDACPQTRYTTTGDVRLLTPLRINAAGDLAGGAWKEQVVAEGCGSTRLLNTLTVAEPGGGTRTQPLLPGTTIADPQLQRDSVAFAAAAMGDMPPGCDQGAIIDTRFIGADGTASGAVPATPAFEHPWVEVWTAQACARRAEVTMHFKPDNDGTAIQADLKPPG